MQNELTNDRLGTPVQLSSLKIEANLYDFNS